jgi:hypothetical protein
LGGNGTPEPGQEFILAYKVTFLNRGASAALVVTTERETLPSFVGAKIQTSGAMSTFEGTETKRVPRC